MMLVFQIAKNSPNQLAQEEQPVNLKSILPEGLFSPKKQKTELHQHQDPLNEINDNALNTIILFMNSVKW
jgi:hypothetical protein